MPTKKKTRKKSGDPVPESTPDPRTPIEPTAAALDRAVEDVAAVVAKLTPPAEPVPGSLVGGMQHIIFCAGLPSGYGQEVIRRLESEYVDSNELRVTEAYEMAELLDDLELPDAFDRCHEVREAINQVYNDQNAVSLEFLRESSASDRTSFFQRVPALTPTVQRYLVALLSFEECIFSDRSTMRAQTRLGLDPKAAKTAEFFAKLKDQLAPFGHVPLGVGPHGKPNAANRAKPALEPELGPACLLTRLAPTKIR